MWWFPVIRHHFATGESIQAKYGRKYPGWLAAEVSNFGMARWLSYWDQKTGRAVRLSRRISNSDTIGGSSVGDNGGSP